MLIHKHDAALDDAEWREFLADHDFGELIASGREREVAVVVPTHFVFDGERTILLHLARPNPVWEHLAENPLAIVSVFGAYTYIPTGWNVEPPIPAEEGVPTSYYAAVQAICRFEIVDDPDALAAILRVQLAHFQPEGGHADVVPGQGRYGALLGGIRGLRGEIIDVRAKFKFGGNRTRATRERIAAELARRAGPRDDAARAHLERRLARTRP